MPNFGKRSRSKLETCHNDIRVVAEMAIRRVDFSVLEGRRTKELQNHYYDIGTSHITWPYGKHNVTMKDTSGKLVDNPDGLSLAFDVAPWRIDWGDSKRFILLAGVILGCAHALDIPMRWGGDWNQDFIFNQKFQDMGHFELLE